MDSRRNGPCLALVRLGLRLGLGLGLGLGSVLGCGRLGTPPKPTHIETSDLSSATEGNRAFAMRLYGVLAQSPGNVFFSPASVRMSLTMAWAGAHAETANELRTALKLGGQPPALHIANANLLQAWTQPPMGAPKDTFTIRLAQGFFAQRERQFAQEYVELLSHRYDAPLSPVDFNSPDTTRIEINSWVEKRTEDKITDLVPQDSVEAGTQLLLVSAIYFKAAWKQPFEPSRTAPGEFKKPNGKIAKVPMMTQSASFAYAESPEAQMLELPYVGDGFVMDLILPRGELAAFESALNDDKLDQLLGPLSAKDVNVVLPKWETTSRFNLREPLRKLGVHAAFEKGQADFSGMDGTRTIFIAGVIHQAFVKLDETGTEGTAESAAKGATKPPPPSGGVVFRADRPFVYLIRDKKRNALLAFGRLVDPTPAS